MFDNFYKPISYLFELTFCIEMYIIETCFKQSVFLSNVNMSSVNRHNSYCPYWFIFYSDRRLHTMYNFVFTLLSLSNSKITVIYKPREFLMATPLNFYNQKLGIKSSSVGIVAIILFIADYSIFMAHNSFKSFKKVSPLLLVLLWYLYVSL